MQPVLQYYDFGSGVTAFSTTRRGGYSEGRFVWVRGLSDPLTTHFLLLI